MSLNLNFNENINVLFDKLEKFIRAKTIVGEPIILGQTTIIPCFCLSVGMGSGESSLLEKKGYGAGGIGAGLKAETIAVVIIQGDKVQLMPVNKSTSMNKLLDMIPDLLAKVSPEVFEKVFSAAKEKRGEGKQDSGSKKGNNEDEEE